MPPCFFVCVAAENTPFCCLTNAGIIESHRCRYDWSNRLIAGDSLLVMNSLSEK